MINRLKKISSLRGPETSGPKQSPRFKGVCFVALTSSVLLAMTLLGCSPISVSEEQKKQIVSSDPAFENVLAAKSQYDAALADLRGKFLLDKNNYESEAALLRKEFQAKRAQFYKEAQQVKAQLDPQREKIKSELAILTVDYKNKLKSARAIKDMLNQAKAITDGKLGTNLSEKDKDQWRKRFDSLAEEYSKVTQEVVYLKDKINILQLKYRSLIQ